MSLEFTQGIRDVTLESQFSIKELAAIEDPQEHTESNNLEDDPPLVCLIKNFIDLLGSSQDTYSSICQNLLDLFPGTPLLLSGNWTCCHKYKYLKDKSSMPRHL